MTEKVKQFVDNVIDLAGIEYNIKEILDYDCDRIYLAIDGKENNYDIRTWDINENKIRYSIFRFDKNGKAEEIVSSKTYFWNI